jgi:hypothetical protein
MFDRSHDASLTRWAGLRNEAQIMRDALDRFPLLGAQDREVNHISVMQEEIDTKVREALAAYWISSDLE